MGEGSIATALIEEHHEIDARIEQFVQKVGVLGDAPSGAEVRGAAESLLGSFAALRRHIYLEEEFVFPSLDDPSLSMAIMVMYREHGQIWRLMDQAEGQIEGEDSAQLVLETCKTMLGELERHNAKEEPIIYPHTDADLDAKQREKLAEFLGSGEMPKGWVCREAVEPAGGRKLPF